MRRGGGDLRGLNFNNTERVGGGGGFWSNDDGTLTHGLRRPKRPENQRDSSIYARYKL